jgi:hypothetical protein
MKVVYLGQLSAWLQMCQLLGDILNYPVFLLPTLPLASKVESFAQIYNLRVDFWLPVSLVA